MPIHDWTRVETGFFHHFHNAWAMHLTDALNDGLLPDGYYALSEQRAGVYVPDVLAFAVEPNIGAAPTGGGVVVSEPAVERTATLRATHVPRPQRRIAVRTARRVVAVIELITPGNKDGPQAVSEFVEKAADIIRGDVHLAVIDVLLPGAADPNGLHPLLWAALNSETPCDIPPPERPLTLAGYAAGAPPCAYLNYAAIGGRLPDVPLFLKGEWHVNLPLEDTYMAGFTRLPAVLKAELE